MENQKLNSLPDIRKTIVVNAPISKVWDAVATAEGLSAWFMPNDLKPEVGHEFHINAGQFGMSPCKVTKVEAPHIISFKWGKDWTLSFELKDLEGKTEFTLIHAGWDADKVTEFGQPHPVVREIMDGGWSGFPKKLAEYVEAA